MKVDISECTDLDAVVRLFDNHKDDPFAHFANTQLFKLIRSLESCKILKAKARGSTVGCIYVMKHMYDCGWVGGLLVDRKFRRKGIGRKLLDEVLTRLRLPYIYAFVMPENIAAKTLFERAGFNVAYRRLNYRVQPFTTGLRRENESVDTEWDELTEAIGFKERRGIVNLGFYPVKLTENTFDDLKNEGKVLKFGDVIAIVENSYVVDINEFSFIFNNHILDKISLSVRNEIVEVNPFYIRPKKHDLIKTLKNFVNREVAIWTYREDPVASKLQLRGSLAALVLELSENALR